MPSVTAMWLSPVVSLVIEKATPARRLPVEASALVSSTSPRLTLFSMPAPSARFFSMTSPSLAKSSIVTSTTSSEML